MFSNFSPKLLIELKTNFLVTSKDLKEKFEKRKQVHWSYLCEPTFKHLTDIKLTCIEIID